MIDQEKLRALRYLKQQAESICDEGPVDEGWQSSELIEGLIALDEVIEIIEATLVIERRIDA